MSLLEARGVTVRFSRKDSRGRRRAWDAVRGVDVALSRGERLGVVGESGSGKTTLAKGLLALEPLAAGTVRFDGESVEALRGERLKAFRRRAQMVFQDPMGSLNPRMTVGAAIAEVLSVHPLAPRHGRAQKVEEVLDVVGLDPGYARRYPHEFSGGQRQRIGIARALVLNPDLLVADEPVSALDVSLQAQILNLLKDLSLARSMACLLVAHDLAVVRYVCDRVMVMFQGCVVEEGPSEAVFGEPCHPYTRLLRDSVPDPDRRPQAGLACDAGTAPARSEAGAAGCAFAHRCPRAADVCRRECPVLGEVAPGRRAACHALPR